MDTQSDHDLIIEMRVELKAIRDDIAKLNNGLKEQADDHEVRIRSLEMTKWLLWGAIALLSFLLTTLSSMWTNIHL